jgi:hypothetical protein
MEDELNIFIGQGRSASEIKQNPNWNGSEWNQ